MLTAAPQLRHRRRLIVAAAVWVLPVLLLASAQPAAACSGGPLLPHGQTYDSYADVIFLGTAVRVDDPRSVLDTTWSSIDPMAWTFVVDFVQKGDVGKRFTIATARMDASCGFTFHLGWRYRVVAWGDMNGYPQVSIGNGTELAQSLPNPPPVEGSFRAILSPSAVLQLVTVLALLAVVGGALAVVWRRRHSRA